MTDFEKRLERAIARGQKARNARDKAEARHALTEEEFKRMHSQYRLELTEHIEECLRKLANHFPGFQFKSEVGEKGWGASITRDDVSISRGKRRRGNAFSRLMMLVRPYSSYHVLDMTAKGTVRNKEVFNRDHFQRIEEADTETFKEMIDVWVIEYAEQYARQ